MWEALARGMLVAGVCALFAAPASAAERLGAVNVVSGSSTAYVDVELPRDVTIQLDKDQKDQGAIVIERGGGSFGGVALVQLGRGDYPGIVMSGRFDPSLTCDGTDCRDDLLTSAGQSTGFQAVFDPTVIDLAAGRYRLFVISDGTPVQATIRLPLDGQKAFTPTNPVHPHTVAGLSAVDPFPMDNFDVFAGRAQLASPGVILMTARVNTVENTGEINIEVCNYEGEEPSGTDFQPGCAATNDHSLYYGNTYIRADRPVSIDWVFELPKGTWRTGGNVVAGGGIESSTWSALWLPTEGPPVPPPAPAVAPAAPAVAAPAKPAPAKPAAKRKKPACPAAKRAKSRAKKRAALRKCARAQAKRRR
jgi:hypothetical protein